MFYIGNQWQFLRKNYYFLRFCMKYKLIGDFSGNSYKYYLKETTDISGLLFNLQFTGYEEIQKIIIFSEASTSRLCSLTPYAAIQI